MKSVSKIIIKTNAICSKCTPSRAQRVVEALKQAGWPAEYGGEGHGSILPSTPEFTEAFYDALDKAAQPTLEERR